MTNNEDSAIAVAQNDIKYIRKTVDEIRENLTNNYVTKAEFWPVKAIVFGGAGIVLVTVFTALVYLVVTTSK